MGMVGNDMKLSINYISLEAVVNIVNKYCLKKNPNKYKIKFHDTYSKLKTHYPAARVWSPAPFEMLFPYSSGDSVNSYHADKLGRSPSGEWISTDTFNNVPIMNQSPKNILLAEELMKAIQDNFADAGKDEDETTEDAQKANGTIPLGRLFRKIFATIRENSGGTWDLFLEHEDGKDDGTIYIINRNAPGVGGVTPLVLDPIGGQNGVREIGLAGKVPKDIQAKAFGGAPDTGGKEEAVEVITEKKSADKDKPQDLSTKSRQTRGKIHKSGYSKDSVSTARGVVREIVNELTAEERAAEGQMLDPTPYPLEVKIKTDGIEGFKFGDTLSSNYLPSRYTKNSGIRVVFTVTKYVHSIKGNDWETELSCLSRIVK
jgi:hypothetical protein